MAFSKTLDNKDIHLRTIAATFNVQHSHQAQLSRCYQCGIKIRSCFIRTHSVCRATRSYCRLRHITVRTFSTIAGFATLHSRVSWPNKPVRISQTRLPRALLLNCHSTTAPTQEHCCLPPREN